MLKLDMEQNNPQFPKRITISISEDIRDDLNYLTEEMNINRSSLIRGLIVNWMVSKKLTFQFKYQEPRSQLMKDAIGYSMEDAHDA